MPKYNVDKTFWRKGLEVKAGEVISLSLGEAKYLGHIVSATKAPVVAEAPAPAPAEAVAEVAPTAVAVEELPARQKRKRDDDNAN